MSKKSVSNRSSIRSEIPLKVESLSSAIESNRQEEASVIDDLNELLLKKSNVLEKKSLLLTTLRPTIRSLEEEQLAVSESLTGTTAVTASVRKTIRDLDIVQRRVQSVVERIDSIFEVKNVVGVQDNNLAMQTELFSVVRKRFDEAISSGAKTNVDEVKKYLKLLVPSDTPRAELLEAFVHYLKEVVKASDTDVSPHPNYLNKLTTIFEGSVSVYEENESFLCDLFDSSLAPRFLLRGLQQLCDEIASVFVAKFMKDRSIDRKAKQAADVNKQSRGSGGGGGGSSVHKRSPSISSSTTFAPPTITTTTTTTTTTTHTPPQTTPNNETATPTSDSKQNVRLDPRDLDILLQEISLLIQRVELFQVFLFDEESRLSDISAKEKEKLQLTSPNSPKSSSLSSFAKRDPQSRTESSNDLVSSIPESRVTISRQSALYAEEHALLAEYAVLEDHFLSESLKKAITLEATNQESPISSSIPDDVFFLFTKVVSRALFTRSSDGISTVLGSCSFGLNDLLRNHYSSRWNAMLSDKAVVLLLSSSPEYVSRISKMLNDSSIVISHITKFSTQVEKSLSNMFESLPRHEKGATKGDDKNKKGNNPDYDKCTFVLGELSESCSMWKQDVSKMISVLSGHCISKCESVLSSYSGVSYGGDRQQVSSSKVEQDGGGGGGGGTLSSNDFISSLFKTVRLVYEPFKTSLMPSTFEQLLRYLAVNVASQMEKIIMRKKFSEMGGLQLDNDVRVIITQLSSWSFSSIRDIFIRLNQIVQLLMLQRPAEALDFASSSSSSSSSSSISWHLTPSEVKSVLRLRIDFSDAVISKLQL